MSLIWDICSTLAIYAMLWKYLSFGRSLSGLDANVCKEQFHVAIARIRETLRVFPCANAELETQQGLKLSSCGQYVIGLCELLLAYPKGVQYAVIKSWMSLVDDMVIQNNWANICSSMF